MLIFLYAIYFCINYCLINYLNRGLPIQPQILTVIVKNLIWDAVAVLVLLAMATVQVRVGRLLGKKLGFALMGLYCGVWLVLLVGTGLYLISSIDFYFTDRILIVVMSWALSAKTASFCLHHLPAHPHYN